MFFITDGYVVHKQDSHVPGLCWIEGDSSNLFQFTEPILYFLHSLATVTQRIDTFFIQYKRKAQRNNNQPYQSFGRMVSTLKHTLISDNQSTAASGICINCGDVGRRGLTCLNCNDSDFGYDAAVGVCSNGCPTLGSLGGSCPCHQDAYFKYDLELLQPLGPCLPNPVAGLQIDNQRSSFQTTTSGNGAKPETPYEMHLRITAGLKARQIQTIKLSTRRLLRKKKMVRLSAHFRNKQTNFPSTVTLF